MDINRYRILQYVSSALFFWSKLETLVQFFLVFRSQFLKAGTFPYWYFLHGSSDGSILGARDSRTMVKFVGNDKVGLPLKRGQVTQALDNEEQQCSLAIPDFTSHGWYAYRTLLTATCA